MILINSRVAKKQGAAISFACIGIAGTALTAFWASLGNFHPLTLVLLIIEVAVSIAAGIIAWQLPKRNIQPLSVLFPIAIVVGSLCYATAFTPLSVPDEDYHYVASYMWSNVFFEGTPSSTMRLEDVEVITDGRLNFWYSSKSINSTASLFNWRAQTDELTTNKLFYKKFALAATLRADHPYNDVRSMVTLPTNPIQNKFPSAIGIAIGRAIGLGAIPTFYLGRYLNAIVWSLIIIAAVRITPLGKGVFISLSLLPMSLHLFGSYSYDGPIIAYALLLTALIIRAIQSELPFSVKEGALILLASVLVAPCKIVYFPIALLALLIPAKRFSSKKSGILFKAFVAVVPVATIALTRMSSIFYVSGAQSVPVTDSTGELTSEVAESYSAAWLVTHPISFFTLLFNTLRIHFLQLISTFIGRSLSWSTDYLFGPIWAMFVYLGMLIASLLRTEHDSKLLGRRAAIAFAVMFILIFLLIYAAMLLTWTAAGSETIDGVQGRYFIPIAALLLIAMRNLAPKAKVDVMPHLTLGFVLLDIAYLTNTVALALAH